MCSRCDGSGGGDYPMHCPTCGGSGEVRRASGYDYADADEVDACYFDTRSVNGGFTELHGDPPHLMGRWMAMHRAHELWRPGDSPFLTL